MKTKHLKTLQVIVTATVTSVLFTNFDFINWGSFASVEVVNEASRVAHAKELLGGHYKGSDAHKLEGRKALNEMIVDKVNNSLAPKWKAQAHTIARTVINESSKYNMDPVFVLAVIKTESKFNPVAVGRFGEIGLMQIKPDTAEWIAKKYKIAWQGKKTLENPAANIRIGLAYMNFLRTTFRGQPVTYVSAYNMGPKNVRRLIANNVKPEEYNSRVMKNYGELYAVISDRSSTVIAAN